MFGALNNNKKESYKLLQTTNSCGRGKSKMILCSFCFSSYVKMELHEDDDQTEETTDWLVINETKMGRYEFTKEQKQLSSVLKGFK